MENTRSGGKHGVSVETRSLSEKHEGTIFSRNSEFSWLKGEDAILLLQIAMKINRREPGFSIMKAN